MPASTYLVFGDLHGKALPAFKLAQAWSRENQVPIAGLLQVGDLADCPGPGRLRNRNDRRTAAARDDPDRLVVGASDEADAVFSDKLCPSAMWFTAGNHEDYELLKTLEREAGAEADSFVVDAYGRVRCVRDGCVASLPGGLRIGALWGIDDRAPRARERIPPRARISRRATTALCASDFDVLLAHESPRDAVLGGSGSEEIGQIIRLGRPVFAFFGHYHHIGCRIKGDFGATEVYHLSHFELDSRAEEASVGVLTWDGTSGHFAYLDPAWLRTVTRHNWRHR